MLRKAGLAFLLGLACAICGAGLPAWGLETSDGTVSVSTEKTTVAGLTAIEVHSSVAGSTVSINRVDINYSGFSSSSVPSGGSYVAGVGATSLDYTVYQNDSLAPGSYIIGVSAPGYYKREIALILDEKTKYYFYFTLAMISGTLDLSVTPEDATVLLDGRAAAAGVLTLPAGQHSLVVRRFGYAEQRLSALVLEKETKTLAVDLAPAPFAISQLRASRTVFNPANAGLFGQVDLRFRVESFGSGRLTIANAAGAVVATADFPSFAAWEQLYTWSGRDETGAPLPDGEYHVRLEARGSPSVAAPQSFVRETDLRIDSGLVIRPRGNLSAVPGLLFFPEARGQGVGTNSMELSWLSAANDLLDPSFALSGAVGIGPGLDLAYGAAAERLASDNGGVDLALALRYGLWNQDRGQTSSGALFVRGAWSGAASPQLPDAASSAELSLPLGLGLGSFGLGAAPGIRLDLASVADSGARLEALGRAGAWVSTSTLRAGISAELAFEYANGSISPAWPLDVGAELRLLLEPSPLEFSVLGLAALSPTSSPSFTIGLGLGLLF